MSGGPRVNRGRLEGPEEAPAWGERLAVLASGPGWRVEQILSGRLESPVEDLLDHVEWVMVVHGRARLDLAGTALDLGPGEWLRIGPGQPHRVLSCDPGTSWLAVHVELDQGRPAAPTHGPQ